MAKFIHVVKAGYNADKQIVEADYTTILNTDFIEFVEPLELSRTDPGKYVRVRYKGEALIIKGSLNHFKKKSSLTLILSRETWLPLLRTAPNVVRDR